MQGTPVFEHENCNGYRVCFPFCEEAQVLSLNILECHIKLHRICPSLYAMILLELTGVFSSKRQVFMIELSMTVLHLNVPLNCQTLIACVQMFGMLPL